MYIVIGAGIIGASVAYSLSRAGAPVTIVDFGRPGSGTSGATFAWVNSHNKKPRAYHDLNVAGMQAHAWLRAQFDAAPWWHDGGSIEWEAGDPVAYRNKIGQLQQWGYKVQWLDHAQVNALAPDLDVSSIGDAPVAYFAEDGWVDPPVYCQALLAAAQRNGARVLSDVRVVGLQRHGARVTGIVTEQGTVIEGDMVINCTGRWADQPALSAGQSIPMAPSAGLMVFTPSLAHSLDRVIFSPEVHIRPDGAGRLLICRNDLEVAPDAAPVNHLLDVRRLLQAAARVLPLLKGVEAEALRVGVRALPVDGFPAVGPAPDVAGYYSVVTHSGVTLAPFLGEAAADEILNGVQRPELASFRASRFTASSPSSH
ncbi:NAD(P)/FAD-dependent oxidoreductase [Herbaspirillum sp. alder98]|uniref:NAD(P)/FAD-dependent oxidoreductase n=1 Tax=Herbaspirillum sp. alder98 TaxID=2913096 RepID=UPI001CD87857|nr:FAD-dependent oxidoreductase [Herbaspirillum sp. alder98]MCA1326847.1 FAD-binding oxidoreductase [Herbaspirillum sp. alder98]